MMYLVFSWNKQGILHVEGVFDDEADAIDVPRKLNRAVSISPLEKNVVLLDKLDWPGSYYVYPDGSVLEKV